MRKKNQFFLFVWLFVVVTLLTNAALANDDNNNDTTQQQQQHPDSNKNNADNNDKYDPDLECTIWLAPSTIPNAGFGMFAGKDFDNGDLLAQEMVIPLYDMPLYNANIRNLPFFLWELYWWDGPDVKTTNEAWMEGMGIVAGFGSAPNTILALLNAEDNYPTFQNSVGLHRSRDPGAGAFAEYGGRTTHAIEDLEAGEELYVNYGYAYFAYRLWYGPVPMYDDLKKARNFFKRYLNLKRKVQEQEENNTAVTSVDAIMEEAWELFVRQNTYFSRILGAFYHHDANEIKVLEEYEGELEELRIDQSRRPIEWIRQHGGCGDHITYGNSTLPQAGRGAFARRNLPAGHLVAPMPLIHLPLREVLDTYPLNIDYDEEEDEDIFTVDRKGKKGAQLLLNYCFGHRDTTMLLCPYGMYNNYVNHNQTLANVRLQWSDGTRSSHHAECMEMPVSEFYDLRTAKLSFELIATRDIEEGEEIFMDYGDEWEEAWQAHVREWKPVEGAEEYIPAFQLNDEEEYFLTEEEQEEDSYPENVHVACWEQFLSTSWRSNWNDEINCPQKLHPVEVIEREQSNDGEYTYVVRDLRNDKVYEHLPQLALAFVDEPHTTDMFLENSFRHHIGIPDDMLPDAWRNVPVKETLVGSRDEL